MVTIQLICVGKLKESFYLSAMGEYQKRLTPFCKFTVLELPESRLPDDPSPALIDQALAREGEAILAARIKGSVLIPLCIEGKPLSSEALALQVSQWGVAGKSALTFVIGGSCGLHPMVKEAAALQLSMSPMTFPHHLARVMVAEQLYRVFQINTGTRYHK